MYSVIAWTIERSKTEARMDHRCAGSNCAFSITLIVNNEIKNRITFACDSPHSDGMSTAELRMNQAENRQFPETLPVLRKVVIVLVGS